MMESKLYGQDLTKSSEFMAKSLKNENQIIYLSIVSQFYPPDYAATGQLLHELGDQLSKLGVKIHFFTGQPGYAYDKESAPNRENLGRISVRRSRTSRIWPKRIRGRALNGLFFCLRAIIHLCRPSNRGEIVLVTTEPPYLTLVGYIIHLLFNTPYICLIYDLYPDVAVELNVIKPNHWLVNFWRWLNNCIWQKAQNIVVLSSTMKDRILANCPDIEDKIIEIHSWADPDLIKPIEKSQNWFAQKFDLVKDFTVLYSGNMGRCHDLDTIIDTAAKLQDEGIKFVFIGAGAKRENCIKKTEDLGLTNCEFLPYQDRSVLPYSLTACDLSLVSIDQGMEGLVAPSKLYGILASGRPVAIICEAHSYLRDLLKEANCGQAFESGDSEGLANYIRLLSKNSKLAGKLGQSGRNYLTEKFTPEMIAQQYFQILLNYRDH
jgi:glycosyltransferase involved in cell wall biosynthesis